MRLTTVFNKLLHLQGVLVDDVTFDHDTISVIDRPNGSRPGRQSGSGLVVRKGSPSAPPISLPTARAGGVKGLKAVGFLAKPTLDAAEHAGTARMLPGYGSSRVTRT